MSDDFGMTQDIEREATKILGKPSEVCFFCHPTHESIELKEFLNNLLRSYKKEQAITPQHPAKVWWKFMHMIYDRLRIYQNVKWNPGVPRYILVERQKWLSLYFVVALGCNVPIVESLMTHWPALRLAKRDIHDHLCHHKSYVVQQELQYVAPIVLTNVVPWDSMVEIMF